MNILVINSGSSSIKFRVYDMQQEVCLAHGTLERIGEAESRLQLVTQATNMATVTSETLPVADHTAGLQWIFDLLHQCGSIDRDNTLRAIGQRVVHGGEDFRAPVLVDEEIIEKIRDCIPLAPLHNPANLAGIEAARQLCPDIPQVAVFDTAFHQQLPAHAYHYALPMYLYRKHHVRRYGFHGTSHQFVVRRAADLLQQPLTSLKLISLHLGNGASAAAVSGGICIDTSMGMTPLEGLIMGTRSGDLDPSIIFYLVRECGIALEEIETLMNRDSGLKGICGANDMREVHHLADSGDAQAQLALDMFCYRICKYIGAYIVALGGLDALIFTAGIGEHDPRVRQAVCDRLAAIGVLLDSKKNRRCTDEPFDIASDQSPVRVLVIPTNEELEIAHQTAATLVAANLA